jgi:hypothetical protein
MKRTWVKPKMKVSDAAIGCAATFEPGKVSINGASSSAMISSPRRNQKPKPNPQPAALGAEGRTEGRRAEGGWMMVGARFQRLWVYRF